MENNILIEATRKDQYIFDLSKDLLDILLQDRTTNEYIKWACSDYVELGEEYKPEEIIRPYQIVGHNTNIIKPRIIKTLEQKSTRTKENAEVFSPSWLCNQQNNLVDTSWFGHENVFNIEILHDWVTIINKIEFPNVKGKSWKDYIDCRRLEITCGEAPYLVSRYDAVSGEKIDLINRIGLLDRKLRVVNENVNNEEEWYKFVIRAYQSIYGFELQGDNLVVARLNLLYTFIDNFHFKWKKDPTIKQLKKIATIISWNIWQMDGIKFTVPYGKSRPKHIQNPLFDGYEEKILDLEKPYCLIKDWRSEKIQTYKSMVQ
ncbi:MAG: restriction endonuclease subunit M [Bacillota bacterium]|nr:restriction endonuclease subunit M [Bacillota bacterium]